MQISFATLCVALFSLVIALVAVIGGIVALLRQRVLVDAETGNVTEVEIPLLGKVKTNYPSVIALFLGVAVVVVVLNWLEVETRKIPLLATVTVSDARAQGMHSADIFLNAVPLELRRSQSGVPVNQPTEIRLDVDRGAQYDVVVYTMTRPDASGSFKRILNHGPVAFERRDGHDVAIYRSELLLE